MEFDIGKIVLENELTISDLELDVIKTPTNVTEKTITENGTYNAVEDDVDGYSIVHVSVSEPSGTIDIVKNGIYDVKNDASANVNVAPLLEEKSVIPTKEVREVTPDNDFDGLSKVIVQPIPDEYIIPEGTRNINQNGDYDVREKATVVVNVPEKVLGSKTITENGVYNPINDGLDGYNYVNVATSGVNINDYYYTKDTYSGGIRSYIKDVPTLNTENLTTMYAFFAGCQNLTNIPNINTSKVTNMSTMFNGCNKIKTIPALNTSKVTDMSGMFSECPALIEVPELDTSNVTTMSSMFNRCKNLKTVPTMNTNKVTNMALMFSYSGITTIPQLDTSKVTNMYNMFYSCLDLITIPKLNFENVNNVSGFLTGASNVINIGGFENLGKAYLTNKSANYTNYGLVLTNCSKLTHDSLMNVINNLYDIKTKGCQAQRLQLGPTNLAKLTEEEIQIATDKGFNVS